ncbi:hypothetical protein SAMN05660776_2314 [Salegentibacter holothuriorum]|uniref:Curlin associated repeat-containing protein n=1 Tax=Salegentibacter holothuriorum TaxID=241145 RepID=A0A1T5D1M9_9FLAO|nr:hypothetical protein [Salegentibacter holothuriorum]SKB65537.1 hypothetical protein SAMN05660776_2314 [Salegentibacter holothuriorum]
MKTISFSISLFLFCFIFQLNAQDNLKQARIQTLVGENFHTIEQKEFKQPTNEIFINQIGDRNQVSTTVRVQENKSVYIQTGNYNNIYSNVNAKTLTSSIIQDGDRNKVFSFVNRPAEEVSLELNQQGNNHHFEQFGSNSIGNKMKFQMNGESRSLIVRNFK